VLAADQTPAANAKFWTTFLNREAPFFSGPEKIASRGNQPVVFAHTRKIKRGYYTVELIDLVEEPNEVDSNEILLRYVRKIEEIVREEPEYYLWSHRRWKHTRPEGIELTM
jgi:KDO2-lipid IV(A) lauroyltransferase